MDRRNFEELCTQYDNGSLPGTIHAIILVSVNEIERIQMGCSLEELDRLKEKFEKKLMAACPEGSAASRFIEGLYVIALCNPVDWDGLGEICERLQNVSASDTPDNGENRENAKEHSVSIGAALCPQDSETGFRAAYDLAAQALKFAKDGSNGQTVIYDPQRHSKIPVPRIFRKKVMIVEDQELARQFLEGIVNGSQDYELVASLRNADLADVYCERSRIDLILMDVYTLGGASGLQAAERIKRKHPEIKIIIITSMPEVSYLDRARAIGVDSFWYKEVSKEPLLQLMDRTMAGESVYPDRTPELQFGEISSYEFTDRELEILRELTSGDTNEEIAARLYISKNTVKDYITKMLLKTGFHSRTELAVKARELGLVVKEPQGN